MTNHFLPDNFPKSFCLKVNITLKGGPDAISTTTQLRRIPLYRFEVANQPLLMSCQTGGGTSTAGGTDLAAAAAAVAGGGAAVSPVPLHTGHTLGPFLSMDNLSTFHHAQGTIAGPSSFSKTMTTTTTKVQISWPKLKAVIAKTCLKDDDDVMMNTATGTFGPTLDNHTLPFSLTELMHESVPPFDGSITSNSSNSGPPSASTTWQPSAPKNTLKSSSMNVTNYTIKVQYYDPDGDLIRITSTMELVEAMEQFGDTKMMRMEAMVQVHPTQSQLKNDDLSGKNDDTDSEGDESDQESERPWRKKVVKSRSVKASKTAKNIGNNARGGRSQKAKAAITAAKAAAATAPAKSMVKRTPGKRKVLPPDTYLQRQAEEALLGAPVGGTIQQARSSRCKKAKKESSSNETSQKVMVNKALYDTDNSDDYDGIDEVMFGARTSRKGTNTLYYDEDYPDGTDLRQETYGRIVYFCRNNDTLVGIAKRYGNVVSVEKLLYDNKVAHLQGLTKTSKLKPGTPIVLPLTYNDKNVEELDG